MANQKRGNSPRQIGRELVRSALKAWHNPQKMGEHTLANLKIVQDWLGITKRANTFSGRALALRHILKQAIEELRPCDSPPDFREKAWRSYLIVQGQYLEGQNPEYLAERLCIAPRMYRYEQAEAIDRLAKILSDWEQYCTIPGFALAYQRTPFLAPPRPPYSLVGRDELLRNLKQQLLSGGNLALSALNGLPGVGKTALAIELAHDPEVRERFQDGVLWAGLGRQPDVLAHLGMWAAALDIPPGEIARLSNINQRAEAIHAAISLRRMLLVIDDAWQPEAALAFQLGGPNCAYLLTTRLSEVAVHFAGNAITVVHELSTEDGARLLAQIAPQMTQVTPEEIQALVLAVGGLPLALTIMGKYLQVEAMSASPRRLYAALDRLRQAKERLQLSCSQLPMRRQVTLSEGVSLSLMASIGLSDAAMDKAAQLALRALAVLPPKPNTFSEEAAMAVSAQPVRALDALSNYGLLESAGPERYTLHQAIHDYARIAPTPTLPRPPFTSPSQAGGAEGGAEARMVEFFVRYVETHATDYATLEIEINNILAAFQAAFEQRMWAILVRGVNAFYRFLETRGLYALAQVHLERARQAAAAWGDEASLATTLLHLGIAEMKRDEYAQAEKHLQASLGLARQLGNRHNMARALNNLGNIPSRRGDYAKAQAYYQQALSIYREIGDRQGEGVTLNNLGIISKQLGDCAKAKAHYKQALRIHQELGDRQGEGTVLNNLGMILNSQGDFAEASTHLNQALGIIREVGDRLTESTVLNNLSAISDNLGDYAGARAYLERSLHIKRETGDRWGESLALANLGLVFHHLGEDQAACDYCRQALRIGQELDSSFVQGYTLIYLGHALTGLERLEEAREAYQQAMSLWHKRGQPHLNMEPLAGLACAWLAQGDLDQAMTCVEEILNCLETDSQPGASEPLLIYLACYRVLRASQDSRAKPILGTAYTLLQERAAKISDQELRRSFLENVAAHREIVEFAAGKDTL